MTEIPASTAPVVDPPLILTDAERSAPGWLVPAILGTASLVQSLNANVITNALPTMAVALKVDPLSLNLAITMFLLSSAVFLPISGWVADKFGAKRIFMTAMVLFAVSSATCGFATNMGELIVSRVFQGMASAMMMPVGRLLLLRTTPRDQLVGALAILTMPQVLGPTLGPVLGGAVVTFFSWRWIFFMNLPVAIMALGLVWRYVPNVAEREVTPMDWLGIILTGVGLACTIFGFENLGRDKLPPLVVVSLFGVGGGALVGYWFHARNNPNAILDRSIFRLQTFRASTIGGGFMRLATGGLPFLLAMLLQIGFGLSAFQAGLTTFVSGAGSLLMKNCAPPILRKFGFRSVLIVNAVIIAVSFMSYSLLTPDIPHWVVLLALGAGGFFRSLQLTTMMGLTYADIDQPQMSRASTTSSIMQQLVQSIGVGFAATLLHLFMSLHGAHHMTVATISPVFLVTGAVTLISLFFFIPLPKNVGADMHGKGRRRAI
jgi:EmrB/QacA subfamily drug resistance transporter